MIQSITTFIIQLFSMLTGIVSMLASTVKAGEHQATNLEEMSSGHLTLARIEREEAVEVRMEAINKARAKRGKAEISSADILAELQDAAENS